MPEEIKTIKDDIIELQIQLSYQEQTIRALDEVIQEQQILIERLQNAFKDLKNHVDSEGITEPFQIEEEQPPHY